MWRDTGRFPRFFMIDARILFPLFAFFLHISKATFYIAAIGVFIFWVLERRGWTPVVLFRSTMRWFARPYHPKADRTVFRRRCRW